MEQGFRKPLTDSMLASTAPPGLLKAPLHRTPATPCRQLSVPPWEPVFGIDVEGSGFSRE